MTHQDSKFKNGDRVKDTISGFKGTVIGVTLWLHGCFRYCVMAEKLNKDSQPVEANFDENQLELIQESNYKAKRTTGGPWPNAQRR